MCMSQLDSSKDKPCQVFHNPGYRPADLNRKREVSVSFTMNDTATGWDSFSSKPWVCSFLHHHQAAERIKYDPFPAHHLSQCEGKHGSPVARSACFSLSPAQLQEHCRRNEIARDSSWSSLPLVCSSLCPISPVALSLGEVGNQRLPCWVRTLYILVQLHCGWSSWAHTTEMIQLQQTHHNLCLFLF